MNRDQYKSLPVFLCFCFNNELDLLHIKLEKLHGVVTKFIISESTYSARGLPKEATFLQHKNETRWQKFLPQIVHLVSRVEPPDTGEGLGWYQIDHVKNVIGEYLRTDSTFTNEYSDGVVLMSDMDELASVEQIKWLQKHCCVDHETITIDMPYYVYGLHWKSKDLGATTMTARRLKDELDFWALLMKDKKNKFKQTVRNIPRDIKGLENGIHCSYCGTDAENVAKLQHVNFVDGPPFLGKYYWDENLFRTLKACGVTPNGQELVHSPGVRQRFAFFDRSEYLYLFQEKRPTCNAVQILNRYRDRVLPSLLSERRVLVEWVT